MKMVMNKSVTYNGAHYPSNTPFDVQDRDVLDLKGKGAYIIEEEKPAKARPQRKPVVDDTVVKKKAAAKTQEKPVEEEK